MPTDKKQSSNSEKETKSHIIPEVDKVQIKKIAAKAKELRVKSGYTYEEFALHAGINRNTYFRFEQSEKKGENYTIALLLKVIRGLNMTVSDFFKDIK
jgi:transcriptional regulator with XRE-family HTH domain